MDPSTEPNGETTQDTVTLQPTGSDGRQREENGIWALLLGSLQADFARYTELNDSTEVSRAAPYEKKYKARQLLVDLLQRVKRHYSSWLTVCSSHNESDRCHSTDSEGEKREERSACDVVDGTWSEDSLTGSAIFLVASHLFSLLGENYYATEELSFCEVPLCNSLELLLQVRGLDLFGDSEWIACLRKAQEGFEKCETVSGQGEERGSNVEGSRQASVTTDSGPPSSRCDTERVEAAVIQALKAAAVSRNGDESVDADLYASSPQTVLSPILSYITEQHGRSPEAECEVLTPQAGPKLIALYWLTSWLDCGECALRSLNSLGLLYCNWSNYEKGLGCLRRAQILGSHLAPSPLIKSDVFRHLKAESKNEAGIPQKCTVCGLRGRDVSIPDPYSHSFLKGRRQQFALTSYYLAQALAGIGEPILGAEFCVDTLNSQLEQVTDILFASDKTPSAQCPLHRWNAISDSFDYRDWIRNVMQLSDYFVNEQLFWTCEYLLTAAESVAKNLLTLLHATQTAVDTATSKAISDDKQSGDSENVDTERVRSTLQAAEKSLKELHAEAVRDLSRYYFLRLKVSEDFMVDSDKGSEAIVAAREHVTLESLVRLLRRKKTANSESAEEKEGPEVSAKEKKREEKSEGLDSVLARDEQCLSEFPFLFRLPVSKVPSSKGGKPTPEGSHEKDDCRWAFKHRVSNPQWTKVCPEIVHYSFGERRALDGSWIKRSPNNARTKEESETSSVVEEGQDHEDIPFATGSPGEVEEVEPAVLKDAKDKLSSEGYLFLTEDLAVRPCILFPSIHRKTEFRMHKRNTEFFAATSNHKEVMDDIGVDGASPVRRKARVLALAGFPAARALYRIAAHLSSQALDFFKLEEHATECTRLTMQQSHLYRLLGAYETVPARAIAMYQRRLALLSPLLEELNPQHYLDYTRQMAFECGSICQEWFLTALTGSVPQFRQAEVVPVSPESEALEKRRMELLGDKILSIANKAVHFYTTFLESFDKSGKPPTKLEEEDRVSYMTALMSRARMLCRIGSTPRERIDNMGKALKDFELMHFHSSDEEVLKNNSSVKQQHDLCKEMIKLIPIRMSAMAARGC